MAVNQKTTELTENTSRHFNDLVAMVDDPVGTPLSQKMKILHLTGLIVNAQTGTTYTYLTGDYEKLVTHSNGSSIAGTLPQAGATFPANWFMFVQNRGAGTLTITPTTSTIDGAATLTLSQNEGAIIVSDGTNYFTLRGKATGVAGVGDVTGPGSATDNAIVRFDLTTGKLIQNSTISIDDTGAITVPEMAAPSTPASGKVAVYAKSDGKLYIKDDAGTETDLAATGNIGGSTGATDNRALRADGTGGSTVQSSNLTIPDDAATTEVGYLNIPQNSQSADYTAVLVDRGCHVLHPAADNNPRTFTIPANASVAYPIGTTLTFVNEINTITIAITSDTLTLAGAGTTGSRTLAANGMATALKITSTKWMISGEGLTGLIVFFGLLELLRFVQ